MHNNLNYEYVNKSKIQKLRVNCPTKIFYKYQKLETEVVNNFNYLGIFITNTGKCEREIRRHLTMTSSVTIKLNMYIRYTKTSPPLEQRNPETIFAGVELLDRTAKQRIPTTRNWCTYKSRNQKKLHVSSAVLSILLEDQKQCSC